MKTLRFQDRGEEVRVLQEKLSQQGFFRGAIKGNFLEQTRAAVLYFQQTHLGPDGKPLDVDGVVGDDTWWALDNPSGPAQRSNLHPEIPAGLTPLRVRQLEIALAEHRAGIREKPDGSNWGPVQKYLTGTPCPWCCYFWSWCNHQLQGRYDLGARYGSVASAWKKAGTLGMAREKGAYQPIPGDAFVMLHRNSRGQRTGTGHIGFVVRVEERGGRATAINTVEGNCGNRVKVGRRDLSSPDIVGFINPFPAHEQPTGFARGLVRASSVAGEGTR